MLFERSGGINLRSVLFFLLLCACVILPASATTLYFPPSSGIGLMNSFNTFYISGYSTDGIDFFLDGPLSTGITSLVFSASGDMGSQVSAFASGAGDFTSTFAEASAGANQTASALAGASFLTRLTAPAATSGEIVVQIDAPTLAVEGNAQSGMGLSMYLNASDLFFAAVQLNPDGQLITLGDFSDSDFSVQTTGQEITARLIHQTFSIPFSLPATAPGLGINFSFGQDYSAVAQDGGTAIVADVPEPATLWILSGGALGLLLFRRARPNAWAEPCRRKKRGSVILSLQAFSARASLGLYIIDPIVNVMESGSNEVLVCKLRRLLTNGEA